MTFWQLMLAEFKEIISDKAIAITLFGGVVFYSFLYPLPYLHEVPTQQQIVVIDKDHSSLSREFIRHANASPKLQLVAEVQDITQAQKMIAKGDAHGLLVIPEGFRRDLLRQQGVTLAYGGDANYFLIYSAIIEGLMSVGLDSTTQIQELGLLAKGQAAKKVQRDLNPVTLNSVPAFNPSLGYTSYVVPGVLLLVLHQTLLIGGGILGAGQWRQAGYWNSVGVLPLIMARVATLGLIYSLFTSFYFGFCYYWYRVSVQAELLQVVLFLTPFILSTALASVALSCLFSRRDQPTQVFLLVSMPILFVSGFIWPLELIPSPLIWLSQLVPAVLSIQGMLQLNQMGASWQSIAPLWGQLWGLVALYLLLAYFGVKYRLSKS
ncbi:ABC transporter permease [Shewanella sp. Isolate11]|uniref:ABC transporter permease n=1 Tax=Shewanella sp. Isolate11 TaxID=2908530 RepID=UPI001EFEB665|nr:ABC transporter permease [Shewanella sp. Isolate11]MCG9695501.1 ABC transporter permease [Shewanella sp. Isolate11]